jgi:serine/threonine-protein kinase
MNERFGLYTLRERLGAGGTCAVFAAEHPVLRGPFAIKILRRKLLGDPTITRRMLDEASMIARLDHPGIVEVYDFGCSTAGRPFVVLERLVGESLSQRLQRGPLPEDHIVIYTRQLAAALEVAHRRGIVHRDLKPDNIYVVPDPISPCGDRIKLLDFGIAKFRASSCVTGPGIVLGTPAYMAPEQARGLRNLDGRADIYALGVVMYVMATGALPFTGSNTGEILAAHEYCEPVPAAELAAITPELSAIIQRCLAKRPAQRYPAMRDISAALAAVAARRCGELAVPVAPRPDAPRPAMTVRAATVRAATMPAATVRRPWRRALAVIAAIVPAMVIAIVVAVVIAMAIGIAPMAASLGPSP